MKKGNSLKPLVAALLATLAVMGAVVAYMASTASAQDPTIDGTFCMPTMVMFCMQATFDGQTAEGYTGHPAALTLSPGTYSLTVHDDSTGHDFAFRSCPGSFSACVAGVNVPVQELTTKAGEGDVTITVPLTAGTYRLFCDVSPPPVDFTKTGVHEAKGMFVDIVVAALQNANLKGANLENALLPNVNLTGANLLSADGNGGNFSGTQLQGANMQQGTYENADFTGATLSGANIRHDDFTGATLAETNLTNTNLQGANLTSANLAGANLAGANLNSVTWSNTTCPDGTNSNTDGGTCNGHL